MAYCPPIPADLKAMFPAFASVTDETVQLWLDRAARQVTTDWTEGDYEYGMMLLACHLMTQQGLGTGAEAEAAAAGATGFRVMRSGSLTLERFDPAAGGPNAGPYSDTAYGRQFAQLQRQNIGGPRVTGTGTIPCSYPGRYPWGC